MKLNVFSSHVHTLLQNYFVTMNGWSTYLNANYYQWHIQNEPKKTYAEILTHSFKRNVICYEQIQV